MTLSGADAIGHPVSPYNQVFAESGEWWQGHGRRPEKVQAGETSGRNRDALETGGKNREMREAGGIKRRYKKRWEKQRVETGRKEKRAMETGRLEKRGVERNGSEVGPV